MTATETVGSPADPNARRNALRVLLVDDDRTLRESCTSVLVHDGYEVRSCGRGQEARTVIQREKFDVVLLDMNMSQVSGMTLLRLCLEVNPSVRVIMITGNPSV